MNYSREESEKSNTSDSQSETNLDFNNPIEAGKNVSYVSQNETPFLWGFGCVGWGIVICCVSFLIHFLELESENNLTKNLINLLELLVELIKEIGIALIILGAFSIIIETRAWKEYFGKRLSDILMEQKFLNNLKPEQLANFQTNLLKAYLQNKNLNQDVGKRLSDIVIQKRFIDTLDDKQLERIQANTLKAQFKNDNITREGSFSKYCVDNIQEYINLPYRESVDIMIRILDENPDESTFYVEDDIVYYCRKTKENIQEKVYWIADASEIVSLEKIQIYLRHPSIPFDSEKHFGQTHTKHIILGQYEKDKNADNSKSICTIKEDGQIVCECDISEYKEQDNLEIVVKSKYSIKRGNLQFRRMKYPTNKLTITIKYPEEFDFLYKVFGVDDKQISADVGKGFFWVKFSSWLLPYSGIAWIVKEMGVLQE